MGQFDHLHRAPAEGSRQKWSAPPGAGKGATTRDGSRSRTEAQRPDEQLRTMYACCHPKLKDNVQVALLLHFLCGLDADEIARALFLAVTTVEKRLALGKAVLEASKRPLDLSAQKVAARLTLVQRALHLLFQEGYLGRNSAHRTDLCRDAIRLVKILLEHPPARTGPTYGLAALMCFKAARRDGSEGFVPIGMRDRSNWDPELVAQGLAWLEQSARQWELNAYQIEAAIAAVHASASSADETDWDTIVTLYDSLFAVHPSAMVALDRAIAIGRQRGPERGLKEVLSISDGEVLETAPSYWSTLGEFALQGGKRKEARHAFRKARELARNPFERDHYAARIVACGTVAAPISRAGG